MNIYSNILSSNNYYVYAYLRKDNSPYYIGKGKGERVLHPHRINGKGVHKPKDKSRIVFLETNLFEVGSLAIERRYIRWYGRKDNKTGILHNRTDGGDGSSGRKCTKETRMKISLARKGHSVSDETKCKISLANKGRISKLKGLPRNNPPWNKGLKLTDEQKASYKGKPKSPEHRAKIAATLKAKFNS